MGCSIVNSQGYPVSTTLPSQDNYSRLQQAINLANLVYPHTVGIQKIRKNARFVFWCLTSPQTVQTMLDLLTTPQLAPLKTQFPCLLEKPLKPYGNLGWSQARRTQLIVEHFTFMLKHFPYHIDAIYQNRGIVLYQFQDKDKRSYSINLNSGERREGSLGLQLIDEYGQRLYSISFTISTAENTLYIGSLQGPAESIYNRNETIKSLTKALHGLRTKALMVEVIMMFAQLFEIENICAISKQGHIYQALRYIGSKRNAVSFDYDELWVEYHSKRIDKYTYQLPTQPERKDVDQLNRTKRKLYTKRYQWLDECKTALESSIMLYK
nr:VirK/YbjX family protein [Photobacterium damselae]